MIILLIASFNVPVTPSPCLSFHFINCIIYYDITNFFDKIHLLMLNIAMNSK